MHAPWAPRGRALALAVGPALAGCSETAGGLGPWLFGCAALAVAAGAGWLLGSLRERQRADAELRSARQDQQLLAGLVDCWTWHTDDAHRLQRLQPPSGAPAADWAASAGVGEPLWDRFDDGDGSTLRLRLQSQVPFGDLALKQRSDGSGWQLRGAPRFDERGAFAGYSGTAQPTDAEAASRADQQALDTLLATLETPVVLADADGLGGWQVRRANAAALRFFDAPGGAPAWADMLRQLPAPMRNAIAESQPEGRAEHEGWRLQRAPGDAGLLLVKLPQADADGSAADSASLSFAVSHDLRAPVRVVEGFTRILKEDYGRQLDRVGNDHLDRVLGAAARMNHMIDALLTLAKLSQQPLARQPVNLSQLAAYVVDDLRRGAPERAAEIEIEPGLVANGDPTLLRLVLENLLGNAWKYSARTKKAHIVFAAEMHDGRRAFVVRDNGAGFDMRSAERLFGLFQRLHSANDFPGTGVGLASVRRIVRRHGGDVWADSEPGRGAAFHFTLRE